jgi:predicted alpha/beta hydrolase family esterase
MKKIILIHGWGGTPSNDWFPWLKKELEEKGFEVEAPEMPDTMDPKIKPWIDKIKEIVQNPDKDTYFIGHSIGCQAILRYLQTLDKDVRIGGIILVATWMNLTDETWDEDYTKEKAKPWIETPIDFEKIKNMSDKRIVINSDNDPYVPLSDKDIFKEKLNATVILEHNKGHITGEEGFNKFPTVLNELLKIIEI